MSIRQQIGNSTFTLNGKTYNRRSSNSISVFDISINTTGGGVGGGASVGTGGTPPAGAADGDLWYDTTTAQLHVYTSALPGWIQANGGGGSGGLTLLETKIPNTDHVAGDPQSVEFTDIPTSAVHIKVVVAGIQASNQSNVKVFLGDSTEYYGNLYINSGGNGTTAHFTSSTARSTGNFELSKAGDRWVFTEHGNVSTGYRVMTNPLYKIKMSLTNTIYGFASQGSVSVYYM